MAAPTTRDILFVLLFIVAAAAAVLSFAALRDLAIVCGFSPRLAWLLPVVVDAGAAAGSLTWLGRACPPAATAFGRALALVLLGSSVAGNAVGHALAAYSTGPHWTLVVAVSATAPAVLGAVVHLAVLVVGRTAPAKHLQVDANLGVESPPLTPEGRPQPGVPPVPAADDPPPPPVRKPRATPKRATADRQAAAERSARSRRHRAGDHSVCLPANCPDARAVRAV